MAEDLAQNTMNCRPGCGACCVAPSINSFIPGMPQGKPAGVRCVQLSNDNLCKLFGQPERPAFCATLQASKEMCGDERRQAMAYLSALELLTRP
jgi:Fe-S-cluster containining protein